jgi:hypothetical protein
MYATTALVVLVRWGPVTEIDILGTRIPLGGKEVNSLAPIVLCIVTIFVDHALLTVSAVVREIDENTRCLLALNNEARPIMLRELRLFATGLAGLILSLARWQVMSLLVASPLQELPTTTVSGRVLWSMFLRMMGLAAWIREIFDWAIRIIGRLILVMALILLPFIGATYSVHVNSIIGGPEVSELFKNALYILLGIGAISLVGCSLILFTSYSLDYVESIKHDFIDAERKASDIAPYLKLLRRMTNMLGSTRLEI